MVYKKFPEISNLEISSIALPEFIKVREGGDASIKNVVGFSYFAFSISSLVSFSFDSLIVPVLPSLPEFDFAGCLPNFQCPGLKGILPHTLY